MSTYSLPLPTLINVLKSYTRTPDEGFKVLKVYQKFIHYASLYRTDPFLAPLDTTLIPQKWHDLRSWLHAQHPETNSLQNFPSPHDVFVDVVCHLPEDNVKTDYIVAEDYDIYIGEQTGFTLELLRQHGGFEELLTYIREMQPRCSERTIGEEEKVAIYKDPKKYLIEILRNQLNTTDTKKIENTLAVLTEVSVRVVAVLQECPFVIDETEVGLFCRAATMYARSIVSQPMSNISLALRCDLARLDVAVLARTLLYYGLHVKRRITTRQQLAWYLHHWMAQCVRSAVETDIYSQECDLDVLTAVLRVMRRPFRWEGFFVANPRPLANFVPHGWTSSTGHMFCWDMLIVPPSVEATPRALQDVCREPVSPPRSPYICSTPVLTVDEIDPDSDCAICGDGLAVVEEPGPQMTMRVGCDGGHMYHYACLAHLINGIEAYANKCPICRQEICSLRRSRPIL
jgi:hypothetical protein